MKLNFVLASAILLMLSTKTNAQCNDVNDIAGFEIETLGSSYFTGDQGLGNLELTSEEAYTGSKSLKVDVYSDNVWQVRMYNQNSSCYFPVTNGEVQIISFYAKGEIGDEIVVALLDGNTGIGEKKVVINSTDWKHYIVPITATSTIPDASYRMQFKKEGLYYIDDIQINTYDCNDELGGSAAFDACDICSGGSTGIPVSATCDFIDIPSNHSNLRFDGVLETEMNDDTTLFYRFKKSYSTNDASQSTSGVQVVLRSASPIVKAHFFIDRDRTSNSTYWSSFAVYKDGTLVQENEYHKHEVEIELTMEHLTGGIAEWVITLPAGSAAELIKFEIIDGYTLESVPANEKPVYVAIGNSITQGVGTGTFHTKDTWPWIVADSLDYQLHNFAIGGSSVTDAVLTNFESTITPDLISVLWGYNDVHYRDGWDANVLENKTFPNYRSLLEGLLTQFPEACVTAILSTYTTNMAHGTHSSTRTIENLRAGQLSIIKDLQLLYPNLIYFDGEISTNFPGSLTEPDPVHLNRTGNRALAEAFIDEDPCDLLSVGTDELHLSNQLEAFPNPTSGIVNWNEETKVEITTLNGKLIFQGTTNSYDFSNLSNGIYLIKSNNQVTKVIKK